MKELKNIILRAKMILLFLFFSGFYVEAEPLVKEKEDLSSVQVSEIQNPPLIPKEFNQAKRNGFIAMDLGMACVAYTDCVLLISSDYGIVPESSIFTKGTFEGMIGFSFSKYTTNVNFEAEYNFIKNDGTNTLIPGLALGIFFFGRPSFSTILRVRGFAKIFISKQFAFVPFVTVRHHNANHGLSIEDRGLGLGLGLALRQYF